MSGFGEREGPWTRLRDGLRAYRLITVMWIRSTMTYRASFAMSLFANLVVTSFDFVAILLMFSQVDSLGGYTLPEIALLYGAAGTSFGLVDLALGSVDRLGRRVRDGTLDTLLVRPAPVLAQVAADRFALRRLGRIVQGALILGYALVTLDIEWTPLKVLIMPLMVLSGAGIFAAVFVGARRSSSWRRTPPRCRARSRTAGSRCSSTRSAVFALDLVRGVTFVLPLAFVNWLPALYVLGRPYPVDLPPWVPFTAPLVAIAACAAAGLVWRAGLRAYRSTGS